MKLSLDMFDTAKIPAGAYIRSRTMSAIPFWIAASLAGLIAAGYATVFTAIEQSTIVLFQNHPYWLFGLTPACFLLSWYSVRRFSPEAAGSGIPQLIASLDMDAEKDSSWLDRLLGIEMVIVKCFSSMIAAVGGGIIGREGPTLQISGAVFHAVHKRLPKGTNVTHSSMTVAGAAAGLAAAFNTPLGGIVYVVEELAKVHLTTFRTGVLQAVLIAGLISQWLMGTYLYLGFPQLATVPPSFLGICVLVGAVTGAAGAFYGQILLYTGRWVRRRTMKEGAVLASVFGLLFALLVQFVGLHELGSGKHVLLDLLFRDSGATIWDVVGRYAGGILSYTIGGAGGIFAPSLAAGAAIGSFFQSIMPYPAPHLLVLIGMVGFLTGVTQTPFTSFVLVLEMTDRHSSIFFLMIAALVSHGISRLITQESFYESASKGFHVPPPVPQMAG